jgi:hypothetical protein
LNTASIEMILGVSISSWPIESDPNRIFIERYATPAWFQLMKLGESRQ